MSPEIFIKRALHATQVIRQDSIQRLWSGYGEVVRFSVQGSEVANSVVLKSIQLGEMKAHPRGWQSSFAHQRKVHSYQVEANWYQHWAECCQDSERVAKHLASWQQEGQRYLLLEDLDEAGYPRRCSSLELEEVSVVLHWLACFHTRFLQSYRQPSWPEGLWQRGTYWHLQTRPDEWQAMLDSPLKQSAKNLDEVINQARHQTLVHGDAKLANFCFAEDLNAVAAVDFQYIGRGIGVQDVAYFLGSCLSEDKLNQHLDYLLDSYFSELSRCLIAMGESPDLAEAVAQEWYDLFPIAWADFHRFIMGWSPTHPKNTPFSQKITEQALNQLRRP
ncbi:oxidoreductase family protein [Marinomonas sp.]|uniref:oxidoreductase family protein n=1 Tax=Marinomonas sp. TaxID=1904862 RepID=UPI003BAD324C